MNIDKTKLIKRAGFKTKLLDWWNELKAKGVLGHLGLLLTLMLYTTAGGIVFRALENPAAVASVSALNVSLHRERRLLVATAINSQGRDIYNLSLLVNAALGEYEKALYKAVTGGVQFAEKEENGTTSSEEYQDLGLPTGIIHVSGPGDEDWSLVKAVFFSSTILTTIVIDKTTNLNTEELMKLSLSDKNGFQMMESV